MPPLRGALRRFTFPFRTQAALGLRPLTAPVIVFLPLGFLLGPSGMNLLTVEAIDHLDVVISIVLGTLGVFIGIAAGSQRGAVARMMTASSLEAVATILVVGGATYALLLAWGLPTAIPAVLVALLLGLCASASAAPAVGPSDDRARRIAARIADLDDVLPIVVGGFALAMIAEGGLAPLSAVLLGVGIGAAIAVCGWLLFEESEGPERDVFVLGTLLLLGGSAAYLEISPLLSGLAAGWLWARLPGQTERVVAAHLGKVQHPLVVLLLIIAGAILQPSLAGIWLFAPYVAFRTAGKLSGGWLASRLTEDVAPSDLGAYLIPPGVIGIAFALNILQVSQEAAPPIVFAVSIGAIASELLAVVVTPVPPEPTPV
jgi:hypothetical protein